MFNIIFSFNLDFVYFISFWFVVWRKIVRRGEWVYYIGLVKREDFGCLYLFIYMCVVDIMLYCLEFFLGLKVLFFRLLGVLLIGIF